MIGWCQLDMKQRGRSYSRWCHLRLSDQYLGLLLISGPTLVLKPRAPGPKSSQNWTSVRAKKKKTQWRLQESFNSMIILNHNLDLNPTYFILSDSGQEVKYFQFPGELLMRMLKMLILPLVVSRWSLLLIFLLIKGLEFKALIGQMMFSDIFDQQQLRPCWHSFTDAGQRQEMFELKVKQRV